MSKDFKLDPIIANELKHYGVKGMKWGVRKDRDGDSTPFGRKKQKKAEGELVQTMPLKNGGELRIYRKTDPGWLARKMLSEEDQAKIQSFILADKDGFKVGQASFFKPPGTKTLELEWIGVDKKHRRQGYARAAMNGVINYARDNDINTLNLTATKMGAPLYESLGFVPQTNKFGGVTHHTLTIPDKSIIKHSDFNIKELAKYVVAEIDKLDPDTLEGEHQMPNKMEHIDPIIADELMHYGVKGMRWGVRKDRDGGSRRKRTNDQSAGEASGARPKRQSRRQRRKEEQRTKQEAYQNRALEVFTQASNNPDSLVKVRTEHGPYILTGQQFVDYVSSGGAFDVRTVEVFELEKER